MSTKPHVVKDGMPGTSPWRARLNPGSGMYTVAQSFPSWREALDWLCEQIKRRNSRPSVAAVETPKNGETK